ncbi:MAG: winged helix-turn-helix transcriptional regulator, partial [Kiritimatiellae bacterium]|nr:winged helix-turn-helix transcriptional regulator [Kiritimatiellia bacterium]
MKSPQSNFKVPPFALDRARRGVLVAQISAALRKAIETGYYRPGDMLPPVRTLADFLGVSHGMVERALAVVREEGLTSPRPRVGSVVCARTSPLWKGQVLVVVPPGIGNNFGNAVHAILRDRLTATGYLPVSATVPRSASGAYSDFALLATTMRQQVDFVVLLHDNPGVTRWLSRRGVPFARMTRDTAPGEPPNCVGSVR